MENKPKGKLVIVSAPSGAGKSTIVRALLDAGLGLRFSVSACNRPPRGKEKHGKEYYFLSTEEFQQKIKEGAFLEWEEVYPGRYYGTLLTEVERIRNTGDHVVFDVDVVGGLNIKEAYGEDALAIFVMPPSVEALAERLHKRSTEKDDELQVRLDKAKTELEFAPRFDVQVINDKLEQAIGETIQKVSGFLNESTPSP